MNKIQINIYDKEFINTYEINNRFYLKKSDIQGLLKVKLSTDFTYLRKAYITDNQFKEVLERKVKKAKYAKYKEFSDAINEYGFETYMKAVITLSEERVKAKEREVALANQEFEQWLNIFN